MQSRVVLNNGYWPHSTGKHNRTKLFSIKLVLIYSVVNVVLLGVYFALQITLHDRTALVGYYDRLLTKTEERLLVLEGDVSIFQGVTTLWTVSTTAGEYTETPDKVIYLTLESEADYDGYQAYNSR